MWKKGEGGQFRKYTGEVKTRWVNSERRARACEAVGGGREMWDQAPIMMSPPTRQIELCRSNAFTQVYMFSLSFH